VPTTYRARVVRPDGEIRFVETAAVAVSYQGQPASLAVIRGVTERQGMEERLMRAQRLEAAGRVAGQAAHDLNNLLGPLVALPELLKPLLSADEEAQGMCDTMLEAALRIKDIVEELRALGRRGLVSPRPIDLDVVVQRALAQLPPAPRR
jgi:signal transduction histidine kinase